MNDGTSSDTALDIPPEGSPGRLLLNAVADGIYVFDADWILRYANEAAIATSALTREQLAGQSMAEILALAMPDPPPAGELESFQDAIESEQGDRARRTVDFNTQDGTRPFSVRARALTTHDGAFVGAVASVRDVSDRVAAETELRRQNERLDEFASLVSHDLRNPLNVAQLSLDDLDTDDPEALSRAQRALDRMEDIVEDVLALARADEAVEATAPVSLEDAVRRAWADVTEDEPTLVVEADATIEADRGRLDRAIENLLRNAVQHGGSDVTVRVGLHADGFYVADDGPGIPADERTDVFDSGYSTADQGTGFGLDLVRQAVEAHGWDVDVTESGDGGARFEVSGVDGLHG